MKPNGIDKIGSFTASSVFPVKLLKERGVIGEDGRIAPYHIQLNPTNRCNLKCDFCSCANRNVDLELSWEEMQKLLSKFAELGTRAMTITGGGEPLMYTKINQLIQFAFRLNIRTGLVSNGILINRLEADSITWVRISFSDSRTLNSNFLNNLARVAERMTGTDWAFSYVVTRTPDYDKMATIVKFASEQGFSHVRLVTDLIDLEGPPEMDEVKSHLVNVPGEEIVVYQGRKVYKKGRAKCLISLLKPIIGADGGIWPCCGAQYALKDPQKDYESSMRMCHWTEFEEVKQRQRNFDGSVCVKCYYDDYNEILDLMTKKLTHRKFV